MTKRETLNESLSHLEYEIAMLVAVLPMPTMPRLPAAVTAPASLPPATPPIEALTIGTRRPMPRDHGVDNTTVSYADDATGTATVRMITESSMAFKACRCGDREVITRLPLPGIAIGGETDVALQQNGSLPFAGDRLRGGYQFSVEPHPFEDLRGHRRLAIEDLARLAGIRNIMCRSGFLG